ncbi:AEC family transporter [Castellaniella sp.]|uniref:AEC family transporter n=1 Tax=Castellaniella sp. TaxID=1955812 RepID=UPI002AFE7063|nr:AEC family transporter [Castellaniella sp.]
MDMLLTLLNIVLPVFAVAVLGFAFGRRQARAPDMSFINYANVMVFCPALVFSALVANPVDLGQGWPLVVAGILIIIIPGLLLAGVRCAGISRTAFLVPGMFRNTGNIGIPLMMLAYGKEMLGDIIVLFVLSNLLHFSLGLFLLSRGTNRWLWLRNPNIWAALLGVLLAPHRAWIPDFVTTSIDLTGQIAIPLMLFGLGVRLSQDRIEQLGLALRINGLYLLAGLLTLPLVLWLLPLTPAWARMVALSVMLPPAVLNYLLCEQYRVEPRTVASVVLLGNVLSVVTIPLVVWATLTWI